MFITAIFKDTWDYGKWTPKELDLMLVKNMEK